MKVKLDKSESHSVVSYFLQPHGLYSPWNSPSQNTAVRSLFLLQGIFPTQESNPGLLHCRQILYKLSHQGNPRILEWVAYAFCSRSCQIRNQGWTRVSWTAGEFFTNWATREGKEHVSKNTHTHTHTHTPWSIIQPWKRMKSCHLWQHSWILKALWEMSLRERQKPL